MNAFSFLQLSGTDDDLPPPHRNRFQRGGRAAGSFRPVMVGAAPLPTHNGDMETQIHLIEQEAYCSVIRAFKAQSDAISWVIFFSLLFFIFPFSLSFMCVMVTDLYAFSVNAGFCRKRKA